MRFSTGLFTRAVAVAVVPAVLAVGSIVGGSSAVAAGPDLGPSRSFTASEVYEFLDVVSATSDAAAFDAGGFSYERVIDFPEGAVLETRASLLADSSTDFRDVYYAPGHRAKPEVIEYVYVGPTEQFAFPRPKHAQAVAAYELLGADLNAWVIKKTLDFPGDTMDSWRGLPSGLVALMSSEVFATGGSWDALSRIVTLRGPHAVMDIPVVSRFHVSEAGVVDWFDQVSSESPNYHFDVRLVYEPSPVVLPTSPTPVTWNKYQQALQAPTLRDELEGIAVGVLNSPTIAAGRGVRPKAVVKVAKKQAALAKMLGLVIPVKVRKTKTGAILSARNPFSRKLVKVTLKLQKPYPSTIVTF